VPNIYLYTNGDPINGIDPTGLWTVQIGVNIEACYIGVCFGVAAGPVIGSDWSFAPLNLSASVGVATQPGSLDLHFVGEYTNAESVDDLEGAEVYVGLGAGEAVTGNVDYFRGLADDGCGSYTYHGGRVGLGSGAGISPVEVHAGATVSANPLRDLYVAIRDWIRAR